MCSLSQDSLTSPKRANECVHTLHEWRPKGFSEHPPRQSFVRVNDFSGCCQGLTLHLDVGERGTMAGPPGKVQQTASSLTALAVHSCIPFSFLRRTLFPRRRINMALVRPHQRQQRQRGTVYPTVFFAVLHCCGPCRGTSVHCALRPICTVPRQTIHNFFLTFCSTSPRQSPLDARCRSAHR